MVRFAHIADVHIGSWRDPKMKMLSSKAFEQAVDRCIAQHLDFVIIAGDLFNNALPAIESVKHCVRQLKRLKTNNIPVYIIGGSHDYSASGKTMLDVLEEAELLVNVMKGNVEDGFLQLKFTEDKKTGAKLTGILGKRGMLDKEYYEKLQKTNLEEEGGFKIFLFHTALTEFKPEGYDAMSSSPLELLPKGFDYYAGGHVHYIFEKDEDEYGKIVFPGPLFPANFAELEELKYGGFWICEDKKLIREDIKIKDVINVNLELDNKTPEEAMDIIKKHIPSTVKNCIILLRLSGQIQGKTTDIDFRSVFQELYQRGAYFVMKNTSKMISEEMLIQEISESPSEIEETLLKKHSGQLKVDFNEVEMAKKLIKKLDNEKHEGEKQYEYEERVKKEAGEVIGIQD